MAEEICSLHTEALNVGYNGVPLIHDIEIKLHPGEILTLIGPNGAGKSTILKSIAKYLDIVGGSVFIGKRELKTMSPKDLST
ncbi:MAG: ATP-binding cassette domain-containing protein, partial [Eggerthellales bacterium]|nr:ATP-binding cassette domain-containing protein [Eggerthellales bacterium]